MVSPDPGGFIAERTIAANEGWRLQAIAHAMKPCSLNHKQVLFKKGDWGDCMYFLEHGNVKMHCRANEARTFSFFPGSFFGVEQAVCAPPGLYMPILSSTSP
jgi:CRP-like cAMP-binding protein